jgi:hypothetical protein
VLVGVLATSSGAAVHESRQVPAWLIFDVRRKKFSDAQLSEQMDSEEESVGLDATFRRRPAFRSRSSGAEHAGGFRTLLPRKRKWLFRVRSEKHAAKLRGRVESAFA